MDPIVTPAPAGAPPAQGTPAPGAATTPTKSAAWQGHLAKEGKLREKEAALKKQEDALKAQAAEFESYKQTIANAKKDPLALLKLGGLTPEQLAEVLKNGGKPTPALQTSAVAEEVERLKADLARRDQEAATARQTAEQQAAEASLNDFKTKQAAVIHAAPDKYPFLAAFKAGGAVAEEVLRRYQAAETEPTAAEAQKLMDTVIAEKEAEYAKAFDTDLPAMLAIPQLRAKLEEHLLKLKDPKKPAPAPVPAPKTIEGLGLRSKPPDDAKRDEAGRFKSTTELWKERVARHMTKT